MSIRVHYAWLSGCHASGRRCDRDASCQKLVVVSHQMITLEFTRVLVSFGYGGARSGAVTLCTCGGENHDLMSAALMMWLPRYAWPGHLVARKHCNTTANSKCEHSVNKVNKQTNKLTNRQTTKTTATWPYFIIPGNINPFKVVLTSFSISV